MCMAASLVTVSSSSHSRGAHRQPAQPGASETTLSIYISRSRNSKQMGGG